MNPTPVALDELLAPLKMQRDTFIQEIKDIKDIDLALSMRGNIDPETGAWMSSDEVLAWRRRLVARKNAASLELRDVKNRLHVLAQTSVSKPILSHHVQAVLEDAKQYLRTVRHDPTGGLIERLMHTLYQVATQGIEEKRP